MKMSIRALVVFFCASLLLCIAGCSSNEEKAVRYISKGDKLMESGDTMRAVLQYKNALQLNPKNANAYLALGKALLARKEYQQAYSALTAALELNQGLDEARVEVATLLSSGHPEEALEELSKIGKTEPFETKIAIAKAVAYIRLKQYDQAIEVLRKVKDTETNAEVQRLLAVSLHATGDFKAMEEAAVKACHLDPKAPFAYLFLAKFAAGHGDKQRVVKELDAMVEANGDDTAKLLRAKALEELKMSEEAANAFEKLPDNIEMLKAKSEFYYRQGKIDKAQSILESLLTKEPADTDLALALIALLQSKGDSSAALERIETTLKLDIKPAAREKLLLTKATIMADENEKSAAAQICEEVLKHNEGNPNAHFILGRLLLDAGKFEEAEIHLQQATSAMPENTVARIALARSRFFNKKDSLAADTLNDGIRAYPSNNELRLEYLRMLLARGDDQQALKLLDQGIELKPEEPVFLEARGKILASQSQYSKAEQDFLHVIKAAPDNAAGYIEMGQLMIAQSKRDKAVEWLKHALSVKNGWEGAIPALVAVYGQKGDAKKGLVLVEAEVAKREPSASAFYFLGQVHAKMRDLAEAEKDLAKAAELAPAWSAPHREIAMVFVAEGKIDSAVAEMENMYRLNPSTANTLSLAMLYEQKGRIDEASRMLDELLRKSGESASVMNDLAFLYAEYRSDNQDLEKAAGLAAKAIALQPDNATFLDTAAWVSFKRGDLNSAWSRIQYALSLQPDTGMFNFHAAMIANTRGEKEQASLYLDKALHATLDAASRKAAMELKKQLEG